MAAPASDKSFAGSIPKLYDTHLVPLIFAPYAADLVARLRTLPLTNILEVAAGTGVLTRAMAFALPTHVAIVATDLNQSMLDHAVAVGTSRPVEWRQADVTQLPFADRSFEAVVCQFGAMFFPDKANAFAEVKRVLKPGGVFIFNVWDQIENNEFASTVTKAMAALFPDDPPRFMARTPHGYFDRHVIEHDLKRGGFSAAPRIDIVAARSRAASARIAAIAYCQGTPLRNEIEARDAAKLEDATDVAAVALVKRFGNGAVDGKIQAHVIAVLC